MYRERVNEKLPTEYLLHGTTLGSDRNVVNLSPEH